MAISYVAAGTAATGSTSVAPGFPAGLASNDLMLLCVVNKYPSNGPTTPAGWTLLKQSSGGSGAAASNTGTVYTTVYYQVSDGTEAGTETVTISSGNSAAARIFAFRNAGGAWTLDAAGGSQNSASTSWSVTCDSPIRVLSGDVVVSVVGINTSLSTIDAAGSSTVTVGAATFGTDTERTETDSVSGDNCSLQVASHTVTSAATAAPVVVRALAGSAADRPAGSAIAVVLSEFAESAAGVADALIEVDVTNDPRSGVTTWTDITSYARGVINITRGRQDEMADQLAPATCSLLLDNSDGRFTPDNTSGPYGSGFRKGIQVRVSVDLDGNTYRRFRGYVDTIDGPEWPGGVTQQSFVQLTCSDELAQWSKGRRFKDVLTETILRDVPDAYYPLTDGDLADESGNNQKRLQIESRNGGGLIDIRDGLSDRERGVLVDILNGVTRDLDREGNAEKNWKGGSFRFKQGAQGGHNYLDRETLTIAASDKWAISCWCRLSRDSDGNGGWLVYLKNGTRYLGIGYNSNGEARASVYDATTVANLTRIRITNNDWHHVMVHYTRGGNIELFVDGKSRGTTTAQNWDNSTANPRLWVGSGLYAGASTYYGIQKGNVAHVAVYTGTAADDAKTNVADHYEAGWNGFKGARTGEMIDRVVGWMQFPGTTDIAGGDSTVGDKFAQGSTALEYVQLLIDSEAGSLYTTGDGTLTFHERSYRYDNTTAALDVTELHDVSTGFRTDDQYLVNKARYNLPDGGRGVSTNKASVSDYGPYEKTVETLLQSRGAAELLAEFAIFKWKDPDARLVQYPVDVLTRGTSLGVSALGVEIDDRITMSNLPSQAYSTTVTGYVEGWSETIGTPDAAVWNITFNTSPVYTISDAFVLNSASLGQLNQEKLYY